MKSGTRGEVKISIAASPEVVYGLVSDAPRMAEWSPECRACRWVGDATGPEVGARFAGTNRRGLVRWTTQLEVLTAQPGREFVFATYFKDRQETIWTYRLEPLGDATVVTESFEMATDLPRYVALIERWAIGIKDRKADLEAGMRETLQRLKQAAEAAAIAAPSTHSREADR
ncbi:MAG: SRPBCC family protein [Actinophytocola sp.]|nr:SRPBCC family protein [Actinophytocola sp.]